MPVEEAPEDEIATNSSVKANQPCRLLALPAELRLYIYELIFESLACAQEFDPEISIYTPILLYTSRRVFAEALRPYIKSVNQISSLLQDEMKKSRDSARRAVDEANEALEANAVDKKRKVEVAAKATDEAEGKVEIYRKGVNRMHRQNDKMMKDLRMLFNLHDKMPKFSKAGS